MSQPFLVFLAGFVVGVVLSLLCNITLHLIDRRKR